MLFLLTAGRKGFNCKQLCKIFFNRQDLYSFDPDNKTSDFHQKHVIFTKDRNSSPDEKYLTG
jgi:hypothetical protein